MTTRRTRKDLPDKHPLEKEIQKQILELLTIHGLWSWRNNVGTIRRVDYKGKEHQYMAGVLGMPDVTVVFRDGRVGWIEVKRPGGKLTSPQIVWREQAVRHGHPHLVAFSVADVEAWLKQEKALGVSPQDPGKVA